MIKEQSLNTSVTYKVLNECIITWWISHIHTSPRMPPIPPSLPCQSLNNKALFAFLKLMTDTTPIGEISNLSWACLYSLPCSVHVCKHTFRDKTSGFKRDWATVVPHTHTHTLWAGEKGDTSSFMAGNEPSSHRTDRTEIWTTVKSAADILNVFIVLNVIMNGWMMHNGLNYHFNFLLRP